LRHPRQNLVTFPPESVASLTIPNPTFYYGTAATTANGACNPTFSGDDFTLQFFFALNTFILSPATADMYCGADTYYNIQFAVSGGQVYTNINFGSDIGCSVDGCTVTDFGPLGGIISSYGFGEGGTLFDDCYGSCRIGGYSVSVSTPESSSMISMVTLLIMLARLLWWRPHLSLAATARSILVTTKSEAFRSRSSR
jgi:hypothetical protein